MKTGKLCGKKLFAGLFLFVLLFCIAGLGAFAAETVNVTAEVHYGQTEARSMLAMVNEFRTGSDAWYWNSDDSTKKDLTGTLSELTYDYNLEAIAMQRAAEIAVYYSHTRPNGSSWYSVYVNGTMSYAENIAAGYSTASAAFYGWQETNDSYSGQGHRRAMLSSSYTAIGIGHVYVNGTHYWVQEFGYSNSGASATTANNSVKTVDIALLSSYISDISVTADSSVQMTQTTAGTEIYMNVEYGHSISVPEMTVKIKTSSNWSYQPAIQVTVPYTWTLNNSGENTATLSNGQITGNNYGHAYLETTILGKEIEIKIYVTKLQMSNATVTLGTVAAYKGSAVKPAVLSVTLYGETLKEGTDYTCTYYDSDKVGTAYVYIAGKGNYTGSIKKTYQIVCGHTYQRTVYSKAKCTKVGKYRYTCSICGDSYYEDIPATGHTIASMITTEPGCGTAGVRTCYCSVCLDPSVTYTEEIPATGEHTWTGGSSSIVWASSGKTATVKLECAVCGETKSIKPTITSKKSTNYVIYTAKFTYNGSTYSSTNKVKRTTITKGETFTSGNLKYKVMSVSGKSGKAAVTGPKSTKLASLTIPSTVKVNGVTLKVTSIADKAFKGMPQLTTVTVGKNVTRIGSYAFYGCTNLSSFKCTSTVLSKIGAKAFYKCKKLSSITLKTAKLTKANVGTKAFTGIYSSCTFKVPSAKKKANKAIFKARGAGSKLKVKAI